MSETGLCGQVVLVKRYVILCKPSCGCVVYIRQLQEGYFVIDEIGEPMDVVTLLG